MLNEYKKNIQQLADHVIRIYADHQLILKKLGNQLIRTTPRQHILIWEIRVKQRMHIDMKEELRESLTSQSMWNNDRIYRQFNDIDYDLSTYIDDEQIAVSPRSVAQDIIKKLSKLRKQLHLPVYIDELFSAHLETLKKVYPNSRTNLRIA